jgi:hypothetical protein
MDPIKRKTGAHVEHETDAWIRGVVLYSVVATKLSDYVVDGFAGADRATWEGLFHLILTAIALSSDAMSYGSTKKITAPCGDGRHEIIPFDFNSTAVSMYCPLHRLLACALLAAGGDPVDTLRSCVGRAPMSAKFGLLQLVEAPLRCFVLACKVRSNTDAHA